MLALDRRDARRRREAGARIAHGDALGAQAGDGGGAVVDGVGDAPEALAAVAGGGAERGDELDRDPAEPQADVCGAALGELAPPAFGDREPVTPERERAGQVVAEEHDVVDRGRACVRRAARPRAGNRRAVVRDREDVHAAALLARNREQARVPPAAVVLGDVELGGIANGDAGGAERDRRLLEIVAAERDREQSFGDVLEECGEADRHRMHG